MKKRYVIDRIEGDTAVFVGDGGEVSEFKLSELRFGADGRAAGENDVLYVDYDDAGEPVFIENGAERVLSAYRDDAQSAERLASAAARLGKLFGSSGKSR